MELTVYHESGHALLATILGAKVRSMTIDPDRDDGAKRSGDTQIRWPMSRMSARQLAESTVQVCLAGPVAEMVYTGEPYHPGLISEWAADWQAAWSAAQTLHVNERQRLASLEQVCIRLHHWLRRDEIWAALASIADHLLAHETLEGEEIDEIVGDWQGQRVLWTRSGR